ncbi:MAG: hypothetical protein JNG88_13060 [Phycisphaerales bacterium]|nr:hypothetical protein [Phycisphaerales bacterium]
MADPRKTILLRISPDLWAALNTLARDELRSLNAQIEFLLREAARRKGLLNSKESDRPPRPNSNADSADQADDA